jgi:uncharacterized protein involved in cysteine biosynthesis
MAMPMGLVLLMQTPRIKRFLVPPIFLTALAFNLLFVWMWSGISEMFHAIQISDPEALGWKPDWLQNIGEWLVSSQVLIWLVGFGKWIFFLAAAGLMGVWAFSIVYEAIAGPFLDEIHGRLEKEWFGVNPRDSIERPTDLPARRCAQLTLVGTVPAVFLILLFALTHGWIAVAALAAVPLPFVLLSLQNREYGRWLRWVIRVESHTLWISVEAAALAGVVLLAFIWLKFIPGIGPPLFFALAGFTTALSLLDIPLSRRQWSLRQRFGFMARRWPAMLTFGLASSLVYMIPVLGQVIMVPAASIGGMWLVCRLDKNSLRPAELRFGEKGSRPAPAPESEAIGEIGTA